MYVPSDAHTHMRAHTHARARTRPRRHTEMHTHCRAHRCTRKVLRYCAYAYHLGHAPLHNLVGIATWRARCRRDVAGDSFARRFAGTAADLLRWRVREVQGGVRTLGSRGRGGPGRMSKAGWQRALEGRWQCACRWRGPGT